MATALKQNLSSSTDGMGIKVVATATAGTAIHTATSSSTPGSGGTWDEIWLWVYNSDTASRNITIEFGDATAPDHNIFQSIPSQCGLVLVVPGLILQNSATVKAFASAANVVTVSGYINRITN